mgnify:CR=1 FL=1
MLYAVFSLPRAGSHFLQGGLLSHPRVRDEDEALESFGEAKKADLESKSKDKFWHGILVKHHHLENDVLPWLLENVDKTVLLERKNKLRQAVSLNKAHKTGVWRVGYYTKEEKTDVKVSVQVSKSEVKALDERTRRLHSLVFAKMKDPIMVYYEDLCKDYQNQIQKVLRHLGLGCDVNIEAQTERQQTRALSQNISNYHELRRQCLGTKYEKWFS